MTPHTKRTTESHKGTLHCTTILLFHCPSFTPALLHYCQTTDKMQLAIQNHTPAAASYITSHPDKTSDSCRYAGEVRRGLSGRSTLQSDRPDQTRPDQTRLTVLSSVCVTVAVTLAYAAARPDQTRLTVLSSVCVTVAVTLAYAAARSDQTRPDAPLRPFH